MKFDLPQNIKYVLDTLIKSGHKAYIVGGCVRDLLCGNKPHDYDVTTSATPTEIQSLFEKTVATGLKHGTVTVIADGTAIEVTTFRTESVYKDNRHPDTVNFVTEVRDDLARRDFTVNAICYNDTDGLIDCFGGKEDIKNKILRAVGDAKTRFCEDALRILRLFRFSATLDFCIEKNTFDAAIDCAQKLSSISAERIFTELQKLACGNNPKVVCSLLDTGALRDYSLKNTDLSSISKLENRQSLRAFAFLNLTSVSLQNTLDKFKCSNSFKDYCLKMNYLSKNIIDDNKISIKNALKFADCDIASDILLYYREILDFDTARHRALLDEIISNREPYKISQLDISGKDIIECGYDGKDVGNKLEFLLNEVIKAPQLNRRSKLLNLICN